MNGLVLSAGKIVCLHSSVLFTYRESKFNTKWSDKHPSLGTLSFLRLYAIHLIWCNIHVRALPQTPFHTTGPLFQNPAARAFFLPLSSPIPWLFFFSISFTFYLLPFLYRIYWESLYKECWARAVCIFGKESCRGEKFKLALLHVWCIFRYWRCMQSWGML